MFKFIINKIFNKDKPEDVCVSIEVIKPKTSKELFDDAVHKVIKDTLRGSLNTQLIEMCYSEEEVRDTKAAIEKYGSRMRLDKLGEVKSEFSELISELVYQLSNYASQDVKISLTFNYDKFLNRLLKGV